MLNRHQRETLQAMEEQLRRENPGVQDRSGDHPRDRSWLLLLVVAVTVLVAAVVAGYVPGALVAGAAVAVATWRWRATRANPPPRAPHW